ncbi:MAG: integrase, partial [Gammaproteobacteria bacterium]|nr:integrase [Gammaproteobacteria bacterium]
RRILKSYFDYYHEDRTHLGLEKDPPIERPISNQRSTSAQLLELPRLGGLQHRYESSKAA